MKKFIIAFVSALVAFVMVGLIASVLMSDSGDAPDGVDRLGFPFVFKEQSGPVALDYFSWNRLMGDIVIAVAVSACLGFYFAGKSAMTPPDRIGSEVKAPS